MVQVVVAQLVEHLTNDLKFKGLNLAAAGTWPAEVAPLTERSSNDPTFKCQIDIG